MSHGGGFAARAMDAPAESCRDAPEPVIAGRGRVRRRAGTPVNSLVETVVRRLADRGLFATNRGSAKAVAAVCDFYNTALGGVCVLLSRQKNGREGARRMQRMRDLDDKINNLAAIAPDARIGAGHRRLKIARQ